KLRTLVQGFLFHHGQRRGPCLDDHSRPAARGQLLLVESGGQLTGESGGPSRRAAVGLAQVGTESGAFVGEVEGGQHRDPERVDRARAAADLLHLRVDVGGQLLHVSRLRPGLHRVRLAEDLDVDEVRLIRHDRLPRRIISVYSSPSSTSTSRARRRRISSRSWRKEATSSARGSRRRLSSEEEARCFSSVSSLFSASFTRAPSRLRSSSRSWFALRRRLTRSAAFRTFSSSSSKPSSIGLLTLPGSPARPPAAPPPRGPPRPGLPPPSGSV